MGSDILDLIVVVTLVFYALSGARQGFIQEVAGLVGLAAGFWAARAFNDQLSPYLSFITDPGWRPLAACIIIFIAVLVAVGLLARLLKKAVAFSFGAWLDKLAGLILGLVKGALIWALIFIVLEKIVPDAQFMRDSRVLPYFNLLIEQISIYLPPEIASKIVR